MKLTIERPFCPKHRRPATEKKNETQGRVPRITRLVALAIKLDHYVAADQVKNYAEIARLFQLSRARVTQITDLSLLTPGIITALLELPLIQSGRDPIRERHVRPIAREPDWHKQRIMWHQLTETVESID